MTRVGFIGTGHIAAPMVRFLVRRGFDVTVSERGAQTASALKASHGVKVAKNQEVADHCDIVFLCLRPDVAPSALNGLTFRPDHKIVSVMAGVPLAELRRICALATDISMTIPLGFLEFGGCPLPACPDGTVLRTLFEPENPVLDVAREDAFNMHFAVCAAVPGLLDLMITAGEWLAQESGDPDTAAKYTRQLVAGFLTSLPDGGAELMPKERDALATQGTLSLQMTQGLQTGGTHDALVATLNAIGARLRGEA